MSTAVMVYKINLNLEQKKVKAMRYSFYFFLFHLFFNDTQGDSFSSVLIFPHKSIPLDIRDFLSADV